MIWLFIQVADTNVVCN